MASRDNFVPERTAFVNVSSLNPIMSMIVTFPVSPERLFSMMSRIKSSDDAADTVHRNSMRDARNMSSADVDRYIT